MSAPISPDALRLIQEQQKLRTQQQPQSQPPMAPSSPPNEAMASADAALLAAQEVSQLRQQGNLKREAEAADAAASLDEAERFEANAMQARQLADESEAMGQQQRQEADQLAQIHQQEEQAEIEQENQVLDAAKTAELVRVSEDPQVIEQIKPDLAQVIGVDVKAIDQEVQDLSREVQGIFAGQLDTNNQRQAALAEKIKAGEGFSNKEKIALGLAAMLPIIIGAAKGNLGQGLAVAGQAINSIAGQHSADQQALLKERGALEDRQLQVAQGAQAALGLGVDQSGKVSNIDIKQQQAQRDAKTQGLTDKGEILANAAALQKVQQSNIKTDADRLKLQQAAEAYERGEIGGEGGKISGDQRKAAGFAVRMADAQEIFQDLDQRDWAPSRFLPGVPQEARTVDEQQYAQGLKNFVNAILRRESGAAISPEEFKSAEEQYFIQAGDRPELRSQKERNRKVVIASLQAEAGKTAIADIHNILGAEQPQTEALSAEDTVLAQKLIKGLGKKKKAGTDFSSMSDEELQKILGGE